jgi:hypothetical protein
MGTGDALPGVKPDHSPPSTAEVKNEWSCNSKPPNAFMVCTTTTLTFLLQFGKTDWLQMVILWVAVSGENPSCTGQANLLPQHYMVTEDTLDFGWSACLFISGHSTSVKQKKGGISRAGGIYYRLTHIFCDLRYGITMLRTLLTRPRDERQDIVLFSRLPPLCIWGLRSSGMLRCAVWYLVPDVCGLPICPIFMGHFYFGVPNFCAPFHFSYFSTLTLVSQIRESPSILFPPAPKAW